LPGGPLQPFPPIAVSRLQGEWGVVPRPLWDDSLLAAIE
jgi:hypothetical protein